MDDGWEDPSGPEEVGPNAVALMGLSAADVTEMTQAYSTALRAMQEYVVAQRGFTWDSFSPGAVAMKSTMF